MHDDDMSEVKLQLATLTAAVERMEKHIAAYPALDRDLSVLNLKQSHAEEAMQHMRSQLEQSTAACVRADEVIHRRIDDLSKDHTSFSARATGGFYVVCAMGTIVIAICTWALAQITKNTEINIEQTQRLLSVERSLSEVQAKTVQGGKT